MSASADGLLLDSGRRKKTFSTPYIHRLQRRHFLLFDVLPIVGVLIVVAAGTALPLGGFEFATFGVLWFATGIGVTAGFHRLFAHRSFKASPMLRGALAILGMMAGQGPVTSWVALHRRHHEFSDLPGDPHSPNLAGKGIWNGLKGLVHAHFTWMARHEYPNVLHYAPDLLKDPIVARLNRHYIAWVLLGLALPTLAGAVYHGTVAGAFAGLLWGGAIRMFVLGHIIWMINSVLHVSGARAFDTPEGSRNSRLLSLVTLGESWHNNHHAFPASASFGLRWYNLDPGFWFIRACSACGMAQQVHVPDRQAQERLLRRSRKAASSPLETYKEESP